MKKTLVCTILSVICFSLLSADYTSLINEGMMLLNQKKVSESIKVFETARDIKPSDPYAYYYLGEAYYAIGKKSDAIDNYKKAIAIDSNNPDFYYSIAIVYESEGKYQEAINSLDKVIEIAYSSPAGKSAQKLKESIQAQQESREMTQRWARMTEDEIKRQKEEQRTERAADMNPNLPLEAAGMSRDARVESGEKKTPIELIIRRIKFGTEMNRINSSNLLPFYEQSELLAVVSDMIAIVAQDEEPQIRKNVILALGRTETPEAIDTVTKIIQDKSEPYDIKNTVLDSIVKYKSENLKTILRNILNTILEDREKEKREAQPQIDKLNAEIKKLDEQIDNLEKLIRGTPVFDPATRQSSRITAADIQKLEEEQKKADELRPQRVEAQDELNEQKIKLEQQKIKYENLLKPKEERRTDIVVQRTGSSASYQRSRSSSARTGSSTLAYESGQNTSAYRTGSSMPVTGRMYPYEETSEETSEIIFVLKIIRTLGSMRDKQAFPLIEKAWDEYGVENEQTLYSLTLARLGDYKDIQTLVKRIGQNYPQAGLAEEIELRVGIIEVLGEYLVQTPDTKLQGQIEFLSEEGEYPEIRQAAASALRSSTRNLGR